MKFLKLTKAGSKTEIRINFDRVNSYVRYGDDKSTTIAFDQTGTNKEYVKETPEMIDELLGTSPVDFEHSI